jgi:hypothetical protein
MGLGLAAMAGSSSIPSTAEAAGRANTPVWLGAPFAGKYGGTSGRPDTRPGVHERYWGQWAADLYAPKNTGVYLYAAPKDSRLNSAITAKVLSVNPVSCGFSRGGYNVTIGIYHSGTHVGSALYTHISSPAKKGTSISRWGGKIGVVGWYTKSDCWYVSTAAGAHVHFEARNAVGSSCYRGVSKGQSYARSEFIGYIGRNDSGACAPGA